MQSQIERIVVPKEEEVIQLLKTAPDTLVRKGLPIISPLTVIDKGRTAETSSFLADFSQAYESGRLMTTAISAYDMLLHAILTPKGIAERDGVWFEELPYQFMEDIARRKWGDEEMKKATTIGSKVARFILLSSSLWSEYVAKQAQYGRLYEAGVILKGANNQFLSIAFSVPWDKSDVPWHSRLNPIEFFVGREEELQVIDEEIVARKGLSMQEQLVERPQMRMIIDQINDPDSPEKFWGGVAKFVPVLNWSMKEPHFVEKRNNFSTKVLGQLYSRREDSIDAMIRQATEMHGYYITAEEDKYLPGNPEIKTTTKVVQTNLFNFE